jgi:hypothetical protein
MNKKKTKNQANEANEDVQAQINALQVALDEQKKENERLRKMHADMMKEMKSDRRELNKALGETKKRKKKSEDDDTVDEDDDDDGYEDYEPPKKKTTKPKETEKKTKKKKDEDLVATIMVKYVEKNIKSRNYDLDDVPDAIPLEKILGFGIEISSEDVRSNLYSYFQLSYLKMLHF